MHIPKADNPSKKDLDPAILIYESVAILILAFAIIVLKLRYMDLFKENENNERLKRINILKFFKITNFFFISIIFFYSFPKH